MNPKEADMQVRIEPQQQEFNAQPQPREVNGTEEERRRDKMSRAEAGRKGGLSTKQRYGEDHFSRIGRMGGKKGGESTKRRYGVDFYKRIGRKGGSA
jgi:general stress protein YciG